MGSMLPASPLGIAKPRPVMWQGGSAQMKEREIRPRFVAQGIQSLGRQGSSNGLPGERGLGCGAGKEVGTGEGFISLERTRSAVGRQEVAQGISGSFKQFSQKLTSMEGMNPQKRESKGKGAGSR
jgi:hypothetical protein